VVGDVDAGTVGPAVIDGGGDGDAGTLSPAVIDGGGDGEAASENLPDSPAD
jgi:hypothetical protein